MQLKAIKLVVPVLGLFLNLATSSGQTSSQGKTGEPLAVVAGQTIYDDDLLPYIQSQIFKLRLQEYDLKSLTLENVVNQRLVEAEARRKGIPSDKFFEQVVDSKVPEPAEGEIRALYIVQKDQLQRSYEELKPQLAKLLKQARVQEAREQYYKTLREQAGVTILLKRPKVDVSFDPGRLRGNPKAPVVIVEFSDFQCPYCRQAQPVLKSVLAKYEGKVSLAYRDLPLRDIHPQAQLAAEASRCAGEQGKFWEYHDILFANPSKFTRDDMIGHARNQKLDEKQFDSCLLSGKYKEQIEQDRLTGLKAGVSGTPGFFINGNMLSGNLPQEAFEKAIEAELSAAKGKH